MAAGNGPSFIPGQFNEAETVAHNSLPGPLQQMLDLERGPASSETESRFLAPVRPQAFWRVFGGQVLSQCITAAMQTVPRGRHVHSVHGYFLRPGSAEKKIEIAVEDLRDGGSFSARRSQAYQDGVPILSMISSFQTGSEDIEHQLQMPDWVPAPETLPAPEELLGDVKHPILREWSSGRPFEIRHIEAPLYLSPDPHRSPTTAVWFKSRETLPDDPRIHEAALLYASDYTLLETVLRRHGLYWAQPGLKAASLDHAFWWHRPARVDEWLLYVQESPTAQNARGLTNGSIFSADGRLVASAAQEGMVRSPQSFGDRLKGGMQQVSMRTGSTRGYRQRYRSVWGQKER